MNRFKSATNNELLNYCSRATRVSHLAQDRADRLPALSRSQLVQLGHSWRAIQLAKRALREVLLRSYEPDRCSSCDQVLCVCEELRFYYHASNAEARCPLPN